MSAATRERPSARETAFGGEIELRFSFNADLVDDLKTEIPARYRHWDPDERRWLILGVYADTAIDPLVERFPNAELWSDRLVILRERTLARRLPLPPLPVPDGAPAAADDQPERDSLGASVQSPTCGARREQPIQIVAEASTAVAKREVITPELVSICPACNTLAVVSFFPAGAT